jgi:hypothetical protein
VAETTIRALADQEAAAGRPAQALETYRDLLDKVMASKPDPQGDIQQANDLSRIYLAMSRLARLTGNSSDAESIEARRVELWRFWEHKLPRNRYVQRQLNASPGPPA